MVGVNLPLVSHGALIKTMTIGLIPGGWDYFLTYPQLLYSDIAKKLTRRLRPFLIYLVFLKCIVEIKGDNH